MLIINPTLDSVVKKISDENYEESFAFYRFWFDIGRTYHQISPDLVLDAIFENRRTGSIGPDRSGLIQPTSPLILRFASDVESDPILAPHNVGLRSRLCMRIIQEFFNNNLTAIWGNQMNYWDNAPMNFYPDANLIAHWANLGIVEETAIRNHILQSLISHPKLYIHQANALVILFKVAGATFEAYADPSVVDRCFELLKDHYRRGSTMSESANMRAVRVAREELAQVRASVWWNATVGLRGTFRG
jgi:hypothetical protein